VFKLFKKKKKEILFGEHRDGDLVIVEKDGKEHTGDLYKRINGEWFITIYDGSGCMRAEGRIKRPANEKEKEVFRQKMNEV
jgi:hypothetical protein